jgi:hypothetical protein
LSLDADEQDCHEEEEEGDDEANLEEMLKHFFFHITDEQWPVL